MIEREFVREKMKYFKIKEHVEKKINRYAGIGDVVLEKTPLGERVTIYASRPGLVIGSGGETVKALTDDLKSIFKLETPQLEIKEISDPSSWAAVVAKKIASDFDRFGPARYKALGYKALLDVLRTGARGAEIRITGVGIPGERAKTWRFFSGLLKKSGDTAETAVDKAYEVAHMKRGAIGIQVMIMAAGTKLPDDIIIKQPQVEEVKVTKEEQKEVKEAVAVVAKVEKPAKKEKKAKEPKAEAPKEPKKEAKKKDAPAKPTEEKK